MAFRTGRSRALGDGLLAIVAGATLVASPAVASFGAAADYVEHRSMERFLTRRDDPRGYRALRRIEAENRGKRGWLEARTEFSPAAGFHYEIVAEGGSEQIRSRVLRAVLEGEKELVARGEVARSAIAESNYGFQPVGLDDAGLVRIQLSPRRKEVGLLRGTMFLTPDEGDLVRVEGRLSRNPSFWVHRVDVVRSYRRIDGVLLPVALESTAQVRFFGTSTLKMTYEYSEVDGRTVGQ